MKQDITILVLFGLLAASPAFGQNKLLVSKSGLDFNLQTGQILSGDSTTFAYNNQLLLNEYRNWKKVGASNWSWLLELRITDYTYDTDSNLLYFIVQIGDDVNGWSNSWRSIYTYDGEGREISLVGQNWDGLDWHTESVTNREYDTNGNLIKISKIDTRRLFYYNAQGYVDTEIFQVNKNGTWEDRTRYQSTYPPNAIIQTIYSWDNNVWKENSRTSDTYDSNGNLVQGLSEVWDGTSWEKHTLYFSSYNTAGNPLQILSQQWNETFWNNHFLHSYSYDAEGKLIHRVIKKWMDGAWELSFQQSHEYDTESDLINSRSEDWNGTTWKTKNYVRYHYAEFTSADIPLLLPFSLFPNPASTSVTLKSEGLRHANIFDQQGRPVRSQSLAGQPQESLQLGNLPTGTYLVQVLDADGKIGIKPLQIKR